MTTEPKDGEWFPFPAPGTEGLDPLTASAYLAFQTAVDTHYALVIKHTTERVLYPGQVMLLRLLTVSDGVAQRDLADVLRISRPRITRLVQTLEAAGAVHRVRDLQDQRIIRVYLTDMGRQLELEKGTLRNDALNYIFGAMSQSDRKELERLMGFVTQRVEELLQKNNGRD
jgi:MarR family transcriptional regulator, organic hydroperoxide resistance regulator